jgi:hypothetical protein
MPGMFRIIAGIMAGIFFIIAGMPFAIESTPFAMGGIPLIMGSMLFMLAGVADFSFAGFSFVGFSFAGFSFAGFSFAGFSPAGFSLADFSFASFSFAGCVIAGPASLTPTVGNRAAEVAVCAAVESYLSKSALHLPLSCGRRARRQPSILSLLPILLKQNRMTSSVHAARFSASDGPAANPAVANKANAITAEKPSAPRQILVMAASSLVTHCVAMAMESSKTRLAQRSHQGDSFELGHLKAEPQLPNDLSDRYKEWMRKEE